jgi:hypothetical protein
MLAANDLLSSSPNVHPFESLIGRSGAEKEGEDTIVGTTELTVKYQRPDEQKWSTYIVLNPLTSEGAKG